MNTLNMHSVTLLDHHLGCLFFTDKILSFYIARLTVDRRLD